MPARRILSTAAALALVLVSLVFAQPARAVGASCGDLITVPGTLVTLTADIGSPGSPCLDWGISVRADNVVVDLNGHTIWGDGPDVPDFTSPFGIYVTSVAAPTGSSNNVVIKNGTIRGFSSGVFLEEVNGATVTNMTLTDNVGPDFQGIFGDGLQSYLGGGHKITKNRVLNNGPFAGIVLYGPTNNNLVAENQVVNNSVLDDSGHHGGDGAIMQDIGIWVVNLDTGGTATNNVVERNNVVGSGLDGIQIARFTNGNFVRQNQVTNNGFGQPVGNGFRDGDGIAIFGGSNLVESNSVSRNGGNGIQLAFGATGNTVRTNRSIGNGSAPNSIAFDLRDANSVPPCDANTWTSNTEQTKNQACVN